MKNLILFICTVALYSCTSSKKSMREKKLYIGQSKVGYLTVNDAVYTSTKERIEDLFVGQKKNNYYHPSFFLPNDICILREYELYRGRNTDGFVFYKQDAQSFRWKKVVFLPSLDRIEAVTCSSDTVSIVMNNPMLVLRYRFKFERPNFVEKWVHIKL